MISFFSIKDNLTLCRVSDCFRLSVFRPNVYGLFTGRMLDRDQYENYVQTLKKEIEEKDFQIMEHSRSLSNFL